MPSLSERVAKIVVKAVSPDDSVRVRLSFADGFSVSIAPGAVRGRTERELTDEINAALARTVTGANRAFEKVRDDFRGGRPIPPDSPLGLRRREVSRVVAAVEVSQTSPRGLVTATWRGETDLTVRLLSGAVQRVDEVALAAELTNVLAATHNAHARAVGRASLPDVRQNLYTREKNR